MKKMSLLAVCLVSTLVVAAQVRYTGTTLSNPSLHDGGLSPIVGVHCIQTMRANRENPDVEHNVMPWTYNHQPMLTKWRGKFWMHYLSDVASEHVPPSQTFLQTSVDGYKWTAPRTLFPVYSEQSPTAKYQHPSPNDQYAVMHQRVGWYVSSKQTGERLLALGHYGLCPTPKDDPNDGNGIGRVVREVHEDGTFGNIYFLYYNHDFNEKNTRFPLYTRSRDKGFKKACEEILASPLYWMQMVEECDRNDSRLPLKNQYKAFSYYTLPDRTTIVGLWKHTLTSQSRDGGKTWSPQPQRAQGVVNSNAKIWGQRTADGSYITVYNPSEYRWPLALSTSVDGENYTTLNLIHGEISPLRYGGQFKSRGPQYVRGIQEPVLASTKRNMETVAYSMNKEDMWVAHIPVPIRTEVLHHADDDFSTDETLKKWNIMSLVYAPICVENGRLMLADRDHHDYCKAERIIPATRCLEAEFTLTPMQNSHGRLDIELLDGHGTACSRLSLLPDGQFVVKTGARSSAILKNYEVGHEYAVRLLCDLEARMITIWVDGKKSGPKMLMAPVDAVTRIAFRTGEKRYYPTPDSPADTPEGTDLPNAGVIDPLAVFYLNHVKTRQGMSALKPMSQTIDSKIHEYVTKFNEMEPEGIVQAIPNAESEAWMNENIPLFECPDKQIEEMYYYRWWSFRKSIRKTPIGHVINEFLVERSYADKYNLIACALGHHIMEGRWLRNTSYLDEDINVWLRGNDFADSTKLLLRPDGSKSKAMWRLDVFSSWLPYALWQRSLQQGNTDFMKQYNVDLQEDLWRWETNNAYGDGLFWQRDVKDGMEEQISGARKLNNRRPTINSYMYGNYMAMAQLNAGTPLGLQYKAKADTLKSLIEAKLWNPELKFYGTLTTADTLANVREAIGFLPWYFSMPDDNAKKFLPAWQQLTDSKGFDAPFGITTAERRHPLFRKRFRPNHPSCEWDGAVWPFATSQTLTALANILNDYPQLGTAISDTLFFYHLKKYTESQYRRGRPYIGEYLDETNGQWLMGDRERSRYYNHSTYCDLIITGLLGLRPSLTDEGLPKVNPIVPESWDYFRLEHIPYHGRLLRITYDRSGARYRQGKGLTVEYE